MKTGDSWEDALRRVGGISCRYGAGDMLFLQGEPCLRVGYVLSGSIEIRSTTPGGRELPIQTVPAGEFFGDVLSLAGGTRYLGNVFATSSVEVLYVLTDAFLDILAVNRPLLEDYLRLLGGKTFFIKQQVKMLSLPDLRSKILFWLCWNLGEKSTGVVGIPGTKEHLAAFLAVERPSLSRELARMKREGVLDYSRREIFLLRPSGD
jgi:CRP-like cAMP-binding protein